MIALRRQLAGAVRNSRQSILADRGFQIFLLILFFNGAVASPLNSFLPIYVSEKLGESQTLTANLRTVALAFMAIFALVGGIASDALGPRLTFFLGVSGTPAAALIFVVDSPWALYPLAAYEGVGLGLLSTGSQSYLLNATWAARVGTATGLYFAGRSLGGAFGDPLAGAILQTSTFQTLGVIGVVASVPVMLAIWLFLPLVSPRLKYEEGPRRVLAGFVQILSRGHVLALALMQYLRTAFWGAAGLALPFLLKNLTGSNLAVGWFGAASMTAGVAAVLLVGPISDRVGRKKVVLAAIVTMAFGSALLAVVYGSTLGLIAGGVIAAIGAWTLSGQVPPLVKQVERGGEAGRVLAMASFPWALGTLTGSQIHGLLTEANPRLLFGITTALLVLALLAALYMFARRAEADSAAGDRAAAN